jgi:hypothetical protein
MSDERPEGELSAELRELGENLKSAARAAWESEESKRLQQELKSGLAALEDRLRETGSEINTGEAQQRVRAEAHAFGERVRSGEVEARLRTDLLAALRTVNAELKKATRSPDDKA